MDINSVQSAESVFKKIIFKLMNALKKNSNIMNTISVCGKHIDNYTEKLRIISTSLKNNNPYQNDTGYREIIESASIAANKYFDKTTNKTKFCENEITIDNITNKLNPNENNSIKTAINNIKDHINTLKNTDGSDLNATQIAIYLLVFLSIYSEKLNAYMAQLATKISATLLLWEELIKPKGPTVNETLTKISSVGWAAGAATSLICPPVGWGVFAICGLSWLGSLAYTLVKK